MVSSGLLRRVALVRTQKTPFFIVTAVKTSNLTLIEQYAASRMVAGSIPDEVITNIFQLI
jgi:hypothetical protein